MNGKTDKSFDVLENADSQIIDELSEICFPLSSSEIERMFVSAEKKYDRQKNTTDDVFFDKVEGVERYMRPKWYKPVCTAAVSLVVIGGVAGGITLTRSLRNNQPDTSVSEYKKTGLSNLDLSNTKVTENVPKSGEWKIMYFDYQPINDDMINILKAAAKAYNGESIDESKVFCKVFTHGANEPGEDHAFKDMTEERYKNTEFMRYIGDDLYMDTSVFGKIELYDRKNVRDILGIDYEKAWSWRPYLNGSAEKSFDLQTASPVTDSYELNGKQVSVDTALKYALSYLSSGELSPICSAAYEYAPLYAYVYNFGNEKYGYYFTFSLLYDEVPLDASSAGSYEDTVPVANTIKLLMLSENSVDWIWTCVMNQDTPASQEKAEINIDYEKACEIVSDTLSKEHVFTVSEAELIYCVTSRKDESFPWLYTGNKVEPMWQFDIKDVGVQEYKSLCIDVSAADGKVYMRYE